MKRYLYWLLLAACSAIGFAPQWAALRARDPDGIVELGNLKSRVPASWAEVLPEKPQWYKQYRLEPINDDTEPARLTISLAGNGNAPSAADYVKSRLGEFYPPAGKPVRQAVKVGKLSVGRRTVSYLDVRGDYKGLPRNDATPRTDFRLLGVFFDTPRHDYLLCLFGPADTVEYYRQGFENWVKAFK